MIRSLYRSRRRAWALAAPLVLLASVALGVPGHAEEEPEPEPEPMPALPAAQATSVTLITGDRIHVRPQVKGPDAVTIDAAPRANGTVPQFHVTTHGDELRVVPSDIHALVGGTLDAELFNVTALIDQGYDDSNASTLPVIVSYPAEGATDIKAAAAKVPASEPVRELDSINAMAIDVEPNKTSKLTDALASLAAAEARTGKPAQQLTAAEGGPLAGIETIWLDQRIEVQLDRSTGQISAPAAWDAGLDGDGVRVAVLDTGVDQNHPDLAGQVVASRSFTDEEDPSDGHGHGTHVASTVAGTGAASDGARQGVARGVELVNGKVLDDEGTGSLTMIIAGMQWASRQAGADIVNMSLGASGEDPDSVLLERAVDGLTTTQGTLFVVAAGNNGCTERCIDTPGDAAAALTVGAVDREDQVADFSSRGPTFRSSGLKPDITAPGVEIVAARAGANGPDPYVAMSGTSMATPHVAGVTALLAQAHPELGPAELKGALMATAIPTDGFGLYDQGAGRVDVARLLDAPVLAGVGSLDFGTFPFPQDELEPVHRTVTYRNVSDEPVTVRLAIDGVDAVSVSPSELTVAPGDVASADVVLDVASSPLGLQTGQLTASVDGAAPLRTPMAFVTEEEHFELRIEGIARDGRPAVPLMYGVVDVENGDRYVLGTCADGGWTCARVPAGTYSALGYVSTMPSWWDGEGDPAFTGVLHTALVGDPEVPVDSDTTVMLDARDAVEVTVDTPAHEARANLGGAIHLTWRRAPQDGESFGELLVNIEGSQLEERLFMQPMADVAVGEFVASSRWRLEAPTITMEVDSGLELDPRYYPRDWFSDFSWEFPQLEGQVALPLVDAGRGRPSDIAGLALDGALALVRRSDDLTVAEQSNAVAEAGARVVAIYNDEPGHNASTGEIGARLSVPTVRLSHEEGVALRDLLAGGPVEVTAEGELASPYGYELVYLQRDGISDRLAYVADPADLVHVDHAFHSLHADGATYTQDSIAFHPWDERAISQARPLLGAPRARTDYHVWDPDTRWTYFLTTPESDGSIPAPGPGPGPSSQQSLPEPPGAADAHLRLSTPMTTYEQGEHRRISWLEQPLHVDLNPAYPVRRFGDWLVITLGGPRAPDNAWGIGLVDSQLNFSGAATSVGDDGFATRFRVWRGDEVLADTPHAPGGAPDGAVLLPTGEQDRYRMAFEVTNNAPWAELSTRTSTEWSFRSSQTDPQDPQPVELMTVDYDLDVNLHNELLGPRSRRGPKVVELTVGHQAGIDLPLETVTFEASYDDGESWRAVQARRMREGEYIVHLRSRAPRGADFVSFRVHAEDAVGNTVDQEIIRAASVSGGVGGGH